MYEWISHGGCERCDAMEGFYDEEPVRPHPNCQCDIIHHETHTTHSIVAEVTDIDWTERRHWFEDGMWHWEGFFSITGDIRVQCANGTQLMDTFSKDYDWKLDADQPDFYPSGVDGWSDPWYRDAVAVGERLAEQCNEAFRCC